MSRVETLNIGKLGTRDISLAIKVCNIYARQSTEPRSYEASVLLDPKNGNVISVGYSTIDIPSAIMCLTRVPFWRPFKKVLVTLRLPKKTKDLLKIAHSGISTIFYVNGENQEISFLLKNSKIKIYRINNVIMRNV